MQLISCAPYNHFSLYVRTIFSFLLSLGDPFSLTTLVPGSGSPEPPKLTSPGILSYSFTCLKSETVIQHRQPDVGDPNDLQRTRQRILECVSLPRLSTRYLPYHLCLLQIRSHLLMLVSASGELRVY